MASITPNRGASNEIEPDANALGISRAFTSLLQCTVLFIQLRANVFCTLREDRILMEHLDPSEIISLPIPAYPGLWKFTVMSTACILLISTYAATTDAELVAKVAAGTTEDAESSDFEHLNEVPPSRNPTKVQCLVFGTVGIFCGSFFVFTLAILCGASPRGDRLLQTFLASHYLSSIAFAPIFVHAKFYRSPIAYFVSVALGVDDADQGLCSGGTRGCDRKGRASFYESNCRHGMHLSFVGTALCTILVTYDWGAQCQRWPAPMLLGSTIGHASGVTLASLIELWRQRLRPCDVGPSVMKARKCK